MTTFTGLSPIVIALLVILGVIIIVLVIWCISTSNYFKTAKVKIDESKSSIDVALTKRYDLLTKSLATVKGYAKHESETLAKVIELRNSRGISKMDMKEKSEFSAKLDQASKEINVVMEQYPELKANTNFNKLQDQILDCEDNLQAARRIFNSNISEFNRKVVSFPSSIIANMMKIRKEEFFAAEEAKKEDVKIEF